MFFSSWLRNRTSDRPAAHRPDRQPARFRPQLESLDGRLLPSFVAGGGLASSGESAVAVGDFNNDKHPDVASVVVGDMGSSLLEVQLGNRKGQFYGSTLNTSVGSNAWSIAVGNFNKDRYLDVIVTNTDPGGTNAGSVRVFLGKGDGTFTPWGGTWVGAYANAVAVGDFNGDGKLDAVAACAWETDVLLGDGKGGFQSVRNVGPGGGAVAVGDLNGDGRLDIVSGGWSALGNGDGTFQAAQSFSLPGGATSLALADFNGDGKLDVVATNPQAVATNVLLGNGDGTFGAAQSVGPQANAVAVADFNHDGKLDIVTVNLGSTSVSLGNGDGTFQAPLAFGFGGHCVAVGDFNGDGYADLAIDAAVYLNDTKW